MSTSVAIPALAALSVAAGFVFGYGYFLALRRSIDYQSARGAGLHSLLWALARIAAATLFFAVLARWSAAAIGETARQWTAAALLAAFAGFIVARQLALRSARRAS